GLPEGPRRRTARPMDPADRLADRDRPSPPRRQRSDADADAAGPCRARPRASRRRAAGCRGRAAREAADRGGAPPRHGPPLRRDRGGPGVNRGGRARERERRPEVVEGASGMSNELHTISIEEAQARAERADTALREAAEAAGLVDVGIGTMPSPVGELYLAVTREGLACIAFEEQDRDGLERRFAQELSPRVVASARATDAVRRQLDEYFDGARHAFELDLDRRLMSPFVEKVLAATAAVPFGEVSSYGAVASGFADRMRRGLSGQPWARTPSRSWCPATGSSARTASSPATRADSTARSSCSIWRAIRPCSQLRDAL